MATMSMNNGTNLCGSEPPQAILANVAHSIIIEWDKISRFSEIEISSY